MKLTKESFRHPISRSASFVTPAPMIVYGMPGPGDRISMIDSRCDSRIGEYAMPLYYMPAPPPPQPVFLPYTQKMGMSPFDQPGMVMMSGHPGLPYPEVQMRRKMKSSGEPHRRKSWCSRICCAGFAQLLWTIVCIISFGIIASLILALCYMWPTHCPCWFLYIIFNLTTNQTFRRINKEHLSESFVEYQNDDELQEEEKKFNERDDRNSDKNAEDAAEVRQKLGELNSELSDSFVSCVDSHPSVESLCRSCSRASEERFSTSPSPSSARNTLFC